MKDTFIIRTEWQEAIFELEPLDRATIFENLFHFHAGNNNLINLKNLTVKLVWKIIEPTLKRTSDAYDRRVETSKENGKKGGRPITKKKPKKPTKPDSDRKGLDNDRKGKDDEKNIIPFGSQEFIAAWDSFLLSRKQTKKKITEAAIELIFADLLEWGEQKSIVALKNSVKQGWQGVFEPKQQDMASSGVKNGFEHLQGYRPDLHGKQGWKYALSPTGNSITYDRL